jgi:hypothetical protein
MAYGYKKGTEDMEFLFHPFKVTSLYRSIKKIINCKRDTLDIKKDEKTYI